MLHTWLNKYPNVTAHTFLGLFSLIMFASSPINGEFWWSEAPRNALNGAFIMDLVFAFPIDDPATWAKNYYFQHPALTVLFYPPLLHAILGLFYAVFGVSHWVAMLVASLFYFGLATAIYALARRLAPPLVAFAAALAFCASPETAFWGRQVMLEIPMLAFSMWAVWLFLKYLDKGEAKHLYWSVCLLLGAIYTKQSALFFVPILAITLVLTRGIGSLKKKEIWIANAASLIVLLPLIYMQLEFGAFNLTNLQGHNALGIERYSFADWSWYLHNLPAAIGWLPIPFAVAYLLLIIYKPNSRPHKIDATFHSLWFIIGYITISLIAIKQGRYAIPIHFTLFLCAALFIYHSLPKNISAWASILFAVAILTTTLLWSPAPYVSGYREAADHISRIAPRDARVLFAGNRDGSFIFNLRSNPNRNDIQVVRADKLFLNVEIMPQYGLNEKSLSTAEIRDMLNRYGISYVVTVDQFWTHAQVMQDFSNLLHGNLFEEIERVPVVSNQGHDDKLLVIYKNNGELSEPPEPYAIELKAIGRKFEQ